MGLPLEITPETLWRRLGRPDAPLLLDLRVPEDAAADPRRLPASAALAAADAPIWAARFAGREVVTICQRGRKLSHGAAAWLRHHGARASALQGGFLAWAEAGLPLLPAEALPPRDAAGHTVWVTRARPKVDRIACPWLIRRFIDPEAVLLFVPADDVALVAERFAATPFDIPGVRWTHHGELCSFDTMLDGFALHDPALQRLARIVRGADTARFDLAPEAAGLAAVSFGLSALHGDDLVQLEAGLALYDALFAWARDASGETHNWTEPAR
jgi:rhodanese-related sulfurtransferase